MTWAHSRGGKCWGNLGGRLFKEAFCTPGVRPKRLKILPKKTTQTLKPYTGDHAQPSSQRAKKALSDLPQKVDVVRQLPDWSPESSGTHNIQGGSVELVPALVEAVSG